MSSSLSTSLKQRPSLRELNDSSSIEFDKKVFESDRLLHITSLLHNSLDVVEIMELFTSEIKSLVKFDCLKYINEKQNLNLKFGRNSRFTRSYQLEINNEFLGEISFTRRVDFEKRETKELENILNALVYPLRNALKYQQAVNDAHKDTLTGIGNRAAYNETIKREVDMANRHGSPLSMIVLDIDYFKKINDSYGHFIGDCILKKLAFFTKDIIRKTDLLFRYGGEEFVIILPNTNNTGAIRLAQRIRRKIEKADCDCDGHILKLTISAGVAQLGEKETSRELFVKADTALYEAKADGRNIVKISK